MKKLLIALGIIVAVIILVILLKDRIITSAVEKGAEVVSGAPVKIKSLKIGILSTTINLRDFEMGNPEGFPEGTLLAIPEVFVEYDRGALLKKEAHLRDVTVNISQVAIVRNKDGALNVDSLKFVKSSSEAKKEEKSAPSEDIPLKIDQLHLVIGKVIYSDYSKGEKPVVEVFDVNINKTYHDITSAQALAALILTEAMGPTAIKSAAVYGAATVLGVGLLPVGAAVVLTGKDSSETDFTESPEKVFEAASKALKQLGEVKKSDAAKGTLSGKVSGCSISVEITKKDDTTTHVFVSARKMMLPKPKIASGLVYEIEETLKKE